MFMPHREAVKAAREAQTRKACDSGRHVAGCPHRPVIKR